MTELETKIKQNALDRIGEAESIVKQLSLKSQGVGTFNIPIKSIDECSDVLVYNFKHKKFTHVKCRFAINDVRTIEL